MVKNTTHNTNSNCKLKILRYTNSVTVLVEFIDTGYKTTAEAGNIRKGNVKDYLSPTVSGIGFIGIGIYAPHDKDKRTDAFRAWNHMINRCYDKKVQEKHQTYIGCSVCNEWHNFQVFAEWFYKNTIKGFHLDKDIKVKGNKIYSPLTCLFVSPSENNIASHARWYTIISPKNDLIKVYNMGKFCKDNGLTQSSMSRVCDGSRSQHKGYRLARCESKVVNTNITLKP